MAGTVKVKRALVSVSDKTDLIPFARKLHSHGVELISTGGTARALEEAGLPVTPVQKVTGFPEMMDGRVKTLHPKVHGGLLALRDNPEHVAAMKEHDIAAIDLVCVNLYPFEKTIEKGNVPEHEAIENIDIGGPSMIRSAAKNFQYVAVVTNPAQYDRIVNELDANDGATELSLRRWLAGEAFARTAMYDVAIASWMTGRSPDGAGGDQLPDTMLVRAKRKAVLRYGENPHQIGGLYVEPGGGESSVARATQLHGKELSFCNLYDANGALELVKEIDPDHAAAASVIKHANPCGFAVADDLATAFRNAYDGDPLAAFGGIVALNVKVDLAAAEAITEGKKFLEVIVAPGYDDDALEMLRSRWKDVRLLQVAPIVSPDRRDSWELDIKRVTGGLLVQTRDLLPVTPDEWKHVAGPEPTHDDRHQMGLATLAVKHLKSNAVCIVRDGMLVGAGAGQMDRVASCNIAIAKAGDRAKGGYVGSDAFFPFRDGPDLLIKAGVKAIAQPGGSKRDDETIAACNDAGVTLVFTGHRHFRH